ncbi:hypothetical protein KBB08_02350 [Candidatus Gracilibacteria bacterium]|nr:hypothetical protein [Candidatus Gracilibacteria bacterium]
MTDKKRGSGDVTRVHTPDLSALSFDQLTLHTLRQYVTNAFDAYPDNKDARTKYYLDLVESGLPNLQPDVAAARAALNDETQNQLLFDFRVLRNQYRLLAFLAIMGRPESSSPENQ